MREVLLRALRCDIHVFLSAPATREPAPPPPPITTRRPGGAQMSHMIASRPGSGCSPGSHAAGRALRATRWLGSSVAHNAGTKTRSSGPVEPPRYGSDRSPTRPAPTPRSDQHALCIPREVAVATRAAQLRAHVQLRAGRKHPTLRAVFALLQRARRRAAARPPRRRATEESAGTTWRVLAPSVIGQPLNAPATLPITTNCASLASSHRTPIGSNPLPDVPGSHALRRIHQ